MYCSRYVVIHQNVRLTYIKQGTKQTNNSTLKIKILQDVKCVFSENAVRMLFLQEVVVMFIHFIAHKNKKRTSKFCINIDCFAKHMTYGDPPLQKPANNFPTKFFLMTEQKKCSRWHFIAL